MTLFYQWIFLTIFVIIAVFAVAIFIIAHSPARRFSVPFGAHTAVDNDQDTFVGGARRQRSRQLSGRLSKWQNSRSQSSSELKIYEKDLRKYPRTKSEAAIIDIFETLTKQKFPTVVLHVGGKKYELDGYCAPLKLAVEYQGPLHTKWTPSRESYETYLARVLKDQEKKRVCEHFGIHLVVIDMAQHGTGLRVYIESCLADLGLRERPANYALEKNIEPFRNPQLEAELGIAP